MTGDINIGLYVGKKVRIGKAIVNGKTRDKGKMNMMRFTMFSFFET